MQLEQICGHSFFPDLITPGSIVIDGGANRGEFSTWLSSNTPAQVYSFEPDPRIFPLLKPLPRVTYLPLALAANDGVMTLELGTEKCSSLHFSKLGSGEKHQVKTVTLDSFCEANAMARIGLIKMDIEGAEIPVLMSLNEKFIRNVSQFTVEFHDFMDRKEIPRIKEVIQKMKRNGFYYKCFSVFTYADVLFVNKRCYNPGISERLGLSVFKKYGPGGRRRINRLLDSIRQNGAGMSP